MTRSFFYDTWAFAALMNRSDSGHTLAVELDRALERGGFAPVTSDYVFDETVTLLHSAVGARTALEFLDVFRDRLASDVKLVEVGSALRDRAIEVFRRLAPSEPRLSFTDATSFAIMNELGIGLAFTADRHFHRAGKGIEPLVEAHGKKLIAKALSGI